MRLGKCSERSEKPWVAVLIEWLDTTAGNNRSIHLHRENPKRNEVSMLRKEYFPLPTRREIFGDMACAKYFPMLGASAGFWQVSLAKQSTCLCTFCTSSGRHCFCRWLFGLCLAPTVFHRKTQEKNNGGGIKGYWSIRWYSYLEKAVEKHEEKLWVARGLPKYRQ